MRDQNTTAPDFRAVRDDSRVDPQVKAHLTRIAAKGETTYINIHAATHILAVLNRAGL